ncbi:hypothetical protein [Burkholderia vietnamiensis]|uniref:hypothetical protein n=1 Tax=Burkholderia vietnamiensis TaxID=60552 RepID=UPI001CF3DDAF|nr:hypothetical protein [Burkholderia vietnamiensis]MCA8148114.1 hypothetical protein [Burkholderia vietnamiensis]
MSLIALSHLIQLAALSGAESLYVVFAAVLAGTVGLFDGAATGLAVLHAHLNVLGTTARHPWAVGRVAWVVAWC